MIPGMLPPSSRKIKWLFFIAIFSLSLLSCYSNKFPQSISASTKSLILHIPIDANYTSHSIIEIDGNDQLQAFCAGNDSSGNATYPYIICGYDIYCGAAPFGIFLKNIDLHVYIENNHAWNAINIYAAHGYYPSDIMLLNDTNIEILNNSVENGIIGVQLQNCTNITVISNTFKNDLYIGLGINDSSYTILRNNCFIACGVLLDGSLNQCRNQVIDTTNIMNGNGTLYYYKDLVGNISTTIQPKSEIILVNCSKTTINKVQCSSTGIGIIILYSSKISIQNSKFLNLSLYGIITNSSTDLTISDNEVQGTIYGFMVMSTTNTTITGNYAHNNIADGIVLTGNSSRIEFNDCIDNEAWGIKILRARNVTIERNAIIGNSNGGFLAMDNSTNITITRNTVNNNKNCGIEGQASTYINITQNDIENDTIGVFLQDVKNSITDLNNFIDNQAYQAYATWAVFLPDNTTQAWNNTAWGNYWSDYAVKYPNATKMNDTWNTPYTFTTATILNMTDFHPLVMPYQFPFASFHANATRAVAGQKVQFFFTGNSSNEPVILKWDFGDNTTSFVSQNPTHVYVIPGNYTVSLDVTDVQGVHDFVQKLQYITIEPDIHPFANFTCSMTRISVGEIVDFHFTGIIGNAPANITWKIMNDTITTTSLGFQYRFNQAGNFSVTLTVIDYDGEHSTFTVYIMVYAPISMVPLYSVIMILIMTGCLIALIKTINRRRNPPEVTIH